MNIFFGTRGDIRNTQALIEQLKWKFVPANWIKNKPDGTPDLEGEPEKRFMTPSIKPLMLWDLQIPEEHQDIFLNTLFGDSPYKNAGARESKVYNFFVNKLRKILKLDKMPKYDKSKVFPINKDHLDMVFIGIHKDEHWKNGVEKL